MVFKEEMEKEGNWLFRRRGYLPLVIIGLFLLTVREWDYPGENPKMDILREMLCLSISFAGLAVRAITVGHALGGTSGRNKERQEADRLNTTGMYSIVRHPLYLGNFIIYLGIALFTNVWWLILVYVLSFWLYYERIIFAEEEYLSNKFGDEYLAWARATPPFIPDLRKYRKAVLPFSLKTVLKREYSGFIAIILVLFLFETAGDIAHTGRVRPDLIWIIIVSVGFFVWLVLRTLKRKTTFLNADNR